MSECHCIGGKDLAYCDGRKICPQGPCSISPCSNCKLRAFRIPHSPVRRRHVYRPEFYVPKQTIVSSSGFVHELSVTKGTMEVPTFQTAIVGLPDGGLGISDHVALPSLEDDMIMVKNMVVGLNPVDTKMTGQLSTTGAISGMDFAGVVLAVGSKVSTATPIVVGDRVCGAVQGMHSLTPRVGAFAHYVGATDHVTLKLPESMSFEEGAAMGSGISTIGLALFRSLEVPGYPLEPAEKPRHVLVYGGSTATGTLAIQLLKLYVST